MKAAAAILPLAAIAALAIPHGVVRTRCLQATTSCFEDDLGPVCVATLGWVTRDGATGPDILRPTCHKARMKAWLGLEWFVSNVDGRRH